MKKIMSLLSCILLFIISLFFLTGILVFVEQGDFEGIVIFGIPFLLFVTLFYFSYRKYLKMINFNIRNWIESWKNSKILRVIDLTLSCFSFFAFLSAIFFEPGLIIPTILFTLFFGMLYIVKPLLGIKVDLSCFKKKASGLLVTLILLISVSVFRIYFVDVFGIVNIWNMFSEGLTHNTNMSELIILYYFLSGFLAMNITLGLPLMIYSSLIISIDNICNYSSTKQKYIKTLNTYGFYLFALLCLLHVEIIFKSLGWFFVFGFILMLFIINNIFNNKKI